MNVSVVLPSLNSEKDLDRCLSTLKPQLAKDDEIIIVDGGSKDRTLEIANRYGCEIYVYPDVSLGRARNFGTETAKNEIILNSDTDIEWVPWFIDGLKTHYQNDPDVVGVSGGWRDGKNRPLGNLTAAVLEGAMQYADCLVSYRKKVYGMTDGHPDVNFGEQVGMWIQLKKLGKTVYDPNLFVYHYTERYVNIPSYLIGGAVLAGGLTYETVEKADLGYVLIGHGAGWLAGQAGVDLGINRDAPKNHFHHWMLGLTIIGGAMALTGEIPKEMELGLYGFGSGLFAHDLLTESLPQSPIIEPQLLYRAIEKEAKT